MRLLLTGSLAIANSTSTQPGATNHCLPDLGRIRTEQKPLAGGDVG